MIAQAVSDLSLYQGNPSASLMLLVLMGVGSCEETGGNCVLASAVTSSPHGPASPRSKG